MSIKSIIASIAPTKKESVMKQQPSVSKSDALGVSPFLPKEIKHMQAPPKATSPRVAPVKPPPSITDPLGAKSYLPKEIKFNVTAPKISPTQSTYANLVAKSSGERDQAKTLSAIDKARKEEAKIKMKSIEDEIKILGRVKNKTPEQLDKIKLLGREFVKVQAVAKPSGLGFIRGAGFGLGEKALEISEQTGLPIIETFKQAEKEKGFKGGEFAGNLVTQLGTYAAAGAAIKSVPVVAKAAETLGKLGTNLISKLPGVSGLIAEVGAENTAKFIGQQGVDFLIDRVVQEPQAVFKAIQEDETLDEYAKGLLARSALDIAFNLAIGAGGELIGSAVRNKAKTSMSSRAGIEQARLVGIEPDVMMRALNGDAQAIKEVQDVIRPARVTGLEQQPSLDVGRIGADPTAIKQAQDDAFQQWRKENFGGATGKMSDADITALKQMYKDDTGIDLLAPPQSILARSTQQQSIDTSIPRTAEISQPVKAQDTPSVGITPETATAESLMKFRLSFFGASNTNPMQAAINGKLVNIIGSFDENGVRYAALSNGTKVKMDEVFPSSFVEQVGTGPTKVRGFSENIASDAARQEGLAKDFEGKPLEYQQLSQKTTLESAQARFDKGYETALADFDLTKNHLRADNVPLSKLIADEAYKRGDVETARRVITEMAEKLTSAGQFGNAAKILRESNDPLAVLRFVNSEISKLNLQGAKRYGKKWEPISLTDSERQLIERITKDTTDADKTAVFEELFNSVSTRIPTTGMEKFNAWRRIAMLLNPKTHNRNILGNALMYGVKNIANLQAGAMQKLLPKDMRTIGRATKELKEVASNYFSQNSKELMEGSRWEVFGIKAPFADKRIFKNNFLQNLNDLSMKSLEMEDLFFFKKNFVDDLASYMGAKNIKEPTEDAIKYAREKAQEATFRQANKLSEAINELKSSKAGFLVEAAIPFTKTPSNILSASYKYSPLGVVDSAISIVRGADPVVAIDKLSKGLTGTGLSLMGYYLSMNGLLRGGYENNKNVEGLSQATGNLPYSIKTPNGSYAIDWAQPAAVPLFMGVAFAEEMRKGKGDKVQAVFDALMAGGDTMIEQSMLRGVKDLLGTQGSVSEKIAQLPINYVTQAFPTLFGQLARTIDPTKRQTDYSTVVDGIITSMQSKVPVVSKTLPIKRGILGQPQIHGKGAMNAFIQFLSPGAKGERGSELTGEIERLYNSVGSDFLPRASVSKFTAKDPTDFSKSIDYKLNNEEKSEFQRIMGEFTANQLIEMMNDPDYITAPDEAKAKMIKRANDLGYDMAKQAIIELRK